MSYHLFCKELADTDKRFEDEYTVDKASKLGSGVDGSVFKGTRKSDGMQVAVKLVEDCNEKGVKIGGQLQPVEPTFLAKLAHIPGVIGYLDWFKTKDEIAIVMDYHETACSIEYYMEYKTLTENEAKVWFRQIVQAVLACYTAGVLHGDITDENVLIDEANNRIYLIDFGNGIQLADFPETNLRATFFGLSKILKVLVESGYGFGHAFSHSYRELFQLCRGQPTFEDILHHRWFDEENDAGNDNDDDDDQQN